MVYSFCVTVPYGILVTVGGLMGYLKAGSTKSLMAGLLFGGLQMAIGYSSYSKSYLRINERREIIAGMIVASILGMVMFKRYQSGKKFMPAGLITYLSVFIVIFYCYRLVYPFPPPLH